LNRRQVRLWFSWLRAFADGHQRVEPFDVTHSDTSILFSCAGEQLLGILSQPELASATGVLIIVGGPQYRTGSHRQFVLLARALAEAGYPALRFDTRGMGDSGGEARNFERIDQDIAAAIDAIFQHCPQLQRVALWGLNSGSSCSAVGSALAGR
jgi:alpha/beta superfamily hydrolase